MYECRSCTRYHEKWTRNYEFNTYVCQYCDYGVAKEQFEDHSIFNQQNQGNVNQMKSDPCDSPTKDVSKALATNVKRVNQITAWNNWERELIVCIDGQTDNLTLEDKKQIKSRLDNILKLLSSK